MKNIKCFLSDNFPYLVVNFSIYLNRRVFVMFHRSRTMWKCAFEACVDSEDADQRVHRVFVVCLENRWDLWNILMKSKGPADTAWMLKLTRRHR